MFIFEKEASNSCWVALALKKSLKAFTVLTNKTLAKFWHKVQSQIERKIAKKGDRGRPDDLELYSDHRYGLTDKIEDKQKKQMLPK